MGNQGFPLHDSSITLPDGRTQAFAEYGDPAGRPVMFFHGTPGGRLQHPNGLAAGAAGTRMISVERPGYGKTSFHTGWSMVDWAGDVAALADALKIGRFAVVGVSGGGPYAAACAYRLPDRVTAAGLVSSPAPLPVDRRGDGSAPESTEGLDDETVAARTMAWPEFPAWFTQRQGSAPPDAEQMLRLVAEWFPEWDRQVLALPEVQVTLRLAFTEAFRQGIHGWAWDSWMLARPWGFRVEDIAVLTYVWHGEWDQSVPIENGKYLAETIPNCEATFYPGTGHVLPPHRWNAIWASLVGE